MHHHCITAIGFLLTVTQASADLSKKLALNHAKSHTISRRFPESCNSSTVILRHWELIQAPRALYPVSLSVPELCDGSARADIHNGEQEQLIFKVCQPTLSGSLVNGSVEDLNLQTQHCSSHTPSCLIFGPNKVVRYQQSYSKNSEIKRGHAVKTSQHNLIRFQIVRRCICAVFCKCPYMYAD